MTYTKARPEKKSRQNVAPSMKKKKKQLQSWGPQRQIHLILLKQTTGGKSPVLISFLAYTILFILSAHLLHKYLFRKLFFWVS